MSGERQGTLFVIFYLSDLSYFRCNKQKSPSQKINYHNVVAFRDKYVM